ncbi:NAD(P)-dependent alcohol dehydrogenase [Bradyrhizobium sp. 31Argb]|uniref:zinc-dependent alcohol dehydrogenase family protein n=1 Tax=Bradyrhizobium sp. 31Argb TaxID=3141247 RepID=UPI003749EB48
MSETLQVTGKNGLGDLQILSRETPRPFRDMVLVRTTAAALNYRDLALIVGISTAGPSIPYTPLSDACGIVEEVGEDVTGLRPGDRVCSTFFPTWQSGRLAPEKLSMLGASELGVGQQHFLLPQSALARPPDFLTDIQAATLPCAALTAWRAVLDGTGLLPGETILLQGTGGVSIFALQFAVAAGLRAIVTSSSDEKLERAKALGATDGINYRSKPDWAAEALQLTSGKGVDLVVEVGGAGTLAQSIRAVRLEGTISLVGMLAGGTQPLDVRTIYMKNVIVRGITVGSLEMFQRMCKAISAHNIEPVVCKVFPWREARSAFEALKQGGHIGKIVLDFTT